VASALWSPQHAPARSRIAIGAAGDIACASDPSSDPASCQYDDTPNLIDGTGLAEVLTLGRRESGGRQLREAAIASA
jgi:hypothetical protein